MFTLTIKGLWAHKVRYALTSLAIVLGYGYRQRHGRGSPLEEDWTSRSGGSQVAVAMRHEDGSWTPEAVHLISIHRCSEEES